MSRAGMTVRGVACTLVGAAALAGAGTASAATRASASTRASAAAPRSAPSARLVRPAPRTHPLTPFSRRSNDTVTSSNWSGYAVQDAQPFTDVKGSWVQPAVTCSGGSAQYSSFWGGIDGYSSDSVEQLGTDSDCTGHKQPAYYAWYEMYPAGSVDLPASRYPVQPGDTLSSEVSVRGSTFTLSLRSSEGWSYTTSQVGSGLAQSSAELIAESPEICRVSCRLARLADFGTVNFSGVQAAVGGGGDRPFSAFTADSGPHEIIGVTNNGTVRAQPSPLSAGGTAFSIAWKHA